MSDVRELLGRAYNILVVDLEEKGIECEARVTPSGDVATITCTRICTIRLEGFNKHKVVLDFNPSKHRGRRTSTDIATEATGLNEKALRRCVRRCVKLKAEQERLDTVAAKQKKKWEHQKAMVKAVEIPWERDTSGFDDGKFVHESSVDVYKHVININYYETTGYSVELNLYGLSKEQIEDLGKYVDSMVRKEDK